eukprot:Skav210854  [mRNA]  locus=scaffold2829:230778:236446:- [translate_table: standard]
MLRSDPMLLKVREGYDHEYFAERAARLVEDILTMYHMYTVVVVCDGPMVMLAAVGLVVARQKMLHAAVGRGRIASLMGVTFESDTVERWQKDPEKRSLEGDGVSHTEKLRGSES